MNAPVAVIIPTYDRGDAVLRTLRRIAECEPRPAEVWIHIDAGDGRLETVLARTFPDVRVLTSSMRLGPGGGRDRCLRSCTAPYAVSFDDDSYPIDPDFFAVTAKLMDEHSHVAVIAATTWARHQCARPRAAHLTPCIGFVGCGHAIRLAAYRQTRGYLPRPVAYGMEENDVALQLFAAGWTTMQSGELRVVHDTDGNHRSSPDVVGGSVANIALFAFLHYPVSLSGLGALQVLHQALYFAFNGWRAGLVAGFLRIPRDCVAHKAQRRPLPFVTIVKFLRRRRREAVA